MMLNSEYSWTIRTIPTHNNTLNNNILKMNKWGRLPWPFVKKAVKAKKRITALLPKVDKIESNYDFFLLYGNVSGSDLFLLNAYILDYAPVSFGAHVVVGTDVKIITSWHPLDNFNQVRAKTIRIGNNVWLPMNIIVLPGVSIGDNSVIGSGSVVTKDIPANVLAAGNPAKVIRNINRNYEWWKDVEDNQIK